MRRAAWLALLLAGCAGPGPAPSGVEAAVFEVDVTPPLGHALCGGMVAPAARIADPLAARGVLVRSAEGVFVIAALDWTELRNDAYARWRGELARAAGTSPDRVLLSCTHVHDAPYADLGAQRRLEAGLHVDPDFHERAVQATAAAVARAAGEYRRVSHVSAGEADVDQVACNRRVVGPDGKVRFNRYSFTKDPAIRQAPAGEIDPKLKSVGFWDGERAIAVLSYYAVHPMSRYGGGAVSADFPGLARARRQAQTPGTLQVYVTGCAGDLTAARWNDGDEASKAALAERLRDAMERAAASARREPLSGAAFRVGKARFRIPSEGPASAASMQRVLADAKAPKPERLMAALGLSWAERLERGEPVDVPCLELGRVSLLVLPAEAFVSFQLAAQRMRPGRFVAAAGYGECGPGYLPTEAARAEGFVEEHGYCWTAPGAEAELLRAVREALGP